MSKYTAEQVELRAEQLDFLGANSTTVDMLRAYATNLREREAAKAAYWAAISDDGEIVVAYPTNDGNDGETARTECNQYINDALLNDRAVLRPVPLYEVVAPKRGEG